MSLEQKDVPMCNFQYPEELQECMKRAFAGLDRTLAEKTPAGQHLFEKWYAAYYGTAEKTAPFSHTSAFPLFLLPWYLEESITGTTGKKLQQNLIYSSLCGYQYIRIIDNIMDNEADLEKSLLPLLHLFHTEFITVYMEYFPQGHPFWQLFKEVWYSTADVTAADSSLTDMGFREFKEIAARKTAAVKIPLAAVAYFHKNETILTAWQELIDLLGCFHQMHNDLFDWQKDLEAAASTYFLCETQRKIKEAEEKTEEKKSPGGKDLKEQIASIGLPWGYGLLLEWLNELEEKAEKLQSPGLVFYFNHRRALLEEKKKQTETLLDPAAALKKILEKHGVNI